MWWYMPVRLALARVASQVRDQPGSQRLYTKTGSKPWTNIKAKPSKIYTIGKHLLQSLSNKPIFSLGSAGECLELLPTTP